ncbi:SDR family NAD(P)-dependent oxidoreductase [Neoaquamicrobium sediminum]|uniref:SDR family NAD(P)-dependent oxidoreductase n=1 Tax=Neoaquamicrobium sediminum TaxID=1849104 RepID=UPI00156681BD|nr:SDR family oxidoreductase [Mesorhizobium sediminum]NRC56871.1 SDR family oxidoreductase [Mesorhizobium sediminum]
MYDLSNKIAVVIGGNGGVGAATAAAFAEAGATVAVTWRRGERDEAGAAQLRDELEAQGYAAVEADVADTASLKRLRRSVEERFGRIDILVHASGFTKAIPHTDLDALDDEFIDRMFAVNWRGQFATMRELLPLLQASGDALSVFISSIAASNGVGSNIAYCAAKSGTETLVKSLARAFAPGIRVMGVSPGVIDTGFVPGRGADFNNKVAQSIPLKRVASAGDVAGAVLACATHLRYATGTTLVVDGGRLL